MKKFAICIPTHKIKLNPLEINNIKITIKKNNRAPIYFLLPKETKINFFEKKFPNAKFIFFDKIHFRNVTAYNQLLLSPFFYEKFLNYKYIVVCQTDALLIKDVSKLKINNFDYVGAPWIPSQNISYLDIFGSVIIKKILNFFLKKKKLYVGNGGLSIRKVSKFYKISMNFKNISFIKCGEDIYYSYYAKKTKLRISNLNFSSKVFQETGTINMQYKKAIKLYGFHALNIFNPKLEKQIHEKYL